jgi:hypothetical protein
VGETAATGGGMRRGEASPTLKPIENQGLETPGEKTPLPLIVLNHKITGWFHTYDKIYQEAKLTV